MEFNERELLILNLALSDRIFELNREKKNAIKNNHDVNFWIAKLNETHDLQNKILGVE